MHYFCARVVGVALAFGLVLAGCSGEPATSAPGSPPATSAQPAGVPSGASTKPVASTSASPAASGAATKLTVSYSNIVADELPVWIAKEGGYFQNNGLDVTENYVQSSSGIAALLSGETQVFQGGGSETLSAAAGGADVEIVASITPVYPFALEVPASIPSAADLKGKKVGVSSFGSSSDTATRVALQKLGLDPNKDVSILAVGSEETRIQSLINGAIQGGVAQPPSRYDLEAQGMHSLYDLAAQHVPAANTTVVFKKSYADAHSDVVQEYVNSLVQALARERTDEPFSTKVLGQYLKLNNQDVLNRTWQYYVTNIVPSLPTMQPDQLADAVNTLAPRNPAVTNYDVTKLINNTYVNQAKNLAAPSGAGSAGASFGAASAGGSSAGAAGAASGAASSSPRSSGASPSAS